MFAAPRRFLPLSLLPLCFVLTSCGGGSSGGNIVTAKPPIFTSTPGTAATQGSAYGYSVAASDPSGGTVSFALTTGPTGATMSSSTVTWTPNASQSRSANSFTVTATTSEGATATQSWSVTPTGEVTVNWVNTYWEPNGAVQVPIIPAGSLEISAVVPQSDGSITVLKGSTTAPGVITIPGVPAGSYWLALGGANLLPDSTSAYWTNTSTFDAGRDLAGAPVALLNGISTTTFDLSLSGLDSVSVNTALLFQPENHSGTLPLTTLINIPNPFVLTAFISGNIDWSQVSTLFLGQYEPLTMGTLNNAVLGPSTLLTGLSFTNGGTNTITQTLQSSPTRLDLNVAGSQWTSLLNNAGPASPSSYAASFSLFAEPYVSGINVLGSGAAPNLVLAATSTQTGLAFAFSPFGPGCDPLGFPQFPVNSPAIVADQDFGSLQYSDPFPSTWTRAESFCEEGLVPIAIPNSTSTANFALVSGVTAAPSSSAMAPIVSPVQNPTINGGSLFSAATLSTSTPTLSWSAPATGLPYGYRVGVYVQAKLAGIATYEPAGVFYTSQTSIGLPPLSTGNSYVFSITAEVDGAANIQTAPFRSSLPTGFASVVSAPITVNAAAAKTQIHGDARVIERFYQAGPPSLAHDSRASEKIRIVP